MKRYLIVLFALGLFSCDSGTKDETTVSVDSISSPRADSNTVIGDAAYFWEYNDDGKGNITLQKARPIAPDSMNYEAVLALANSQYPELKLEAEKMVNDTLLLRINNGKYFTQQMGSTGPEMFLKELVYNLTELKSIHYVRVKFPEGDHARPGVYTRADFVH